MNMNPFFVLSDICTETISNPKRRYLIPALCGVKLGEHVVTTGASETQLRGPPSLVEQSLEVWNLATRERVADRLGELANMPLDGSAGQDFSSSVWVN